MKSERKIPWNSYSKIRCCNGCVAPKRHPGCHDSCEEYIKAKVDNEFSKENERIHKKIMGRPMGKHDFDMLQPKSERKKLKR